MAPRISFGGRDREPFNHFVFKLVETWQNLTVADFLREFRIQREALKDGLILGSITSISIYLHVGTLVLELSFEHVPCYHTSAEMLGDISQKEVIASAASKQWD